MGRQMAFTAYPGCWYKIEFKKAVCISGNTPRKQWGRMTELKQAGASVYLCKGLRKLGSFHFKSLVVDRRWLFLGSLNFTDKSLDNEESPLAATGPLVNQVLQRLSTQRVKGTLWDGTRNF